MVAENYKRILNDISDVCKNTGREPGSVRLIAVSKTKPVEDLMEAYNAGARDFGENYVQELSEKIPQMPEDVRWHMIGHLQRNKVKYLIGKVFLIHSVDSLRLAEEISKESVKAGVTTNILLEVNASGEDSKWGGSLDETIELVGKAAKLPGIAIKGLMTVAPYTENAEDNRKYFRALKQLSVDIEGRFEDNISMDALSMGMTGDYRVAIEEGATYIRVGTAIFGARDYSNN
ncbi:MAG: YggS family pyridoxal phosphate-dependent enzyme [Lachnospiraceae bacterium]|nr:YggS family pyridoxal phosphate-dependent enzyme [Lachnospiraceae bacterium]